MRGSSVRDTGKVKGDDEARKSDFSSGVAGRAYLGQSKAGRLTSLRERQVLNVPNAQVFRHFANASESDSQKILCRCKFGGFVAEQVAQRFLVTR
ncbi:hypothetical protein H351_31665 (plasmid) [Rhodococcus erythropolis R138]|nr:hypothetical protein H351_31665 [Rhodococcus erythropolis R138]